MGTTCGLIIFILALEVFGAHCKGDDSFWFGDRCEKQRSRHRYRCEGRKASGVGITVESVSKSEETKVTTETIACHL